MSMSRNSLRCAGVNFSARLPPLVAAAWVPDLLALLERTAGVLDDDFLLAATLAVFFEARVSFLLVVVLADFAVVFFEAVFFLPTVVFFAAFFT